MSITTKASTALLLVLGLCQAAHASVLLDSLGGTSSEALSSSFVRTQSFYTGNNGNLGNIELDLSGMSNATGSVIITLYSSNSGALGTSLETITTIPASDLSATEAVYNVYNIPITNLASNTEYWIGVSATSGTSADVYATLSSLSIGTNVAPSNDALQSFSSGTNKYSSNASLAICVSDGNDCETANATPAYSFNLASVQAADPSNAPEPASLALIGSAMAGLGLIRRRRRSRSV